MLVATLEPLKNTFEVAGKPSIPSMENFLSFLGGTFGKLKVTSLALDD